MFDTKKERKNAVDDLKNLQTTPGWGIVVKIAENNIEVLKERIVKKERTDRSRATEEELDMFRERIRAYRDVIETPRNFIKKLSGEATETKKNYDPYFRPEDFMTPAEKTKQKASEVDKGGQSS